MMDKKEMNLKFMIVDDSDFMQNIIKNILKKEGYENIYTANSGTKALTIFKVTKPDIVFLDYNMGQGDGFYALEEIQKLNSKVKCIMVTAIDQQEVIDKAKELGAIHYIKKPFKKEEILEAIEIAKSQMME